MHEPGTALTVVVASDDADGLAVRELALHWHDYGLLGEFAWVTPADVDRSSKGPPTIHATVTEREAPVELMAFLGGRPRSLIRVVLLHLLTHEMSDPTTLVRTCDEIAELVNRSRPRTIDPRGGQHGTQLLRINLMVPESDLLAQDPGIVLPAWEVNAVVSPEDRPELDRQSWFVRRSVNLHGHALNAAAAAGGLWSCSETGAFDTHESDSTTGGGEVVVVRCHTRVVIGDDRSDEVTQALVEQVEDSPVGAATWTAWGVPAATPSSLVRSCSEALLTHPDWAPVESTPEPLHKQQVSLSAVITQWALFQLRLVPAVAHFLFGWGRGLVERSVTAMTVGRDAGEEGKLRPVPPERVAGLADERMQEVEARLRPSVLEEEAATWGQAAPGAWRELRGVAMALVDGSRLPEHYRRPSRGGAVEVVHPGFVVGSPGDVYQVETGARIGLVDVEKAAATVEDIEAYRSTMRDDPPPSSGRHAAKSRRARSADEPADPFGPFLSWLEQRQGTFLWQVTSRVVDLKQQAHARAEAARQTIADAAAPSTERLQTTKQFLVVAWGLALATAALFTVMKLLSTVDESGGLFSAVPDVEWFDLARVVFVVLVVLLTAGTLYFQAMRSYDWAVSRRVHTLQQAGDEYVAARQQERRWQLMQAGLVDWANILSELLHRPWAPPRLSKLAVPTFSGLPAAVAIAVHAESDEGPDTRTVGQIIEQVCHKGWVGEEFGRLVTGSPLNNPAPGARAGGDLAADLDLGLRATGPRRELVEVASSEAMKQEATRRLVDQVAELLRSGDVRLPPHTVVRVGEHADAETTLDRDFLTPRDVIAPFVTELFTPEAQLAGYQLPERTVLVLPEAIEAPDSLTKAIDTELHRSRDQVAIRVDVSALITFDHIALFQRIRRREFQPVHSPDDYN